MTISSRTLVFRIAWVITLAAMGAWLYLMIHVHAKADAVAATAVDFGYPNSDTLDQHLELRLWGIGLFTLYACAVLGVMALAYGKTVSSELFFFSFWALAQVFEIVRIAILYGAAVNPSSTPILLVASRLVVTARYFGLFALFAMGLYAAGFQNDRLGPVILTGFLLALGIGTGLPFDSIRYAPSLMFEAGLEQLRRFFDTAAVALCLANLVYAWLTRGERTYGVATAGVALTAVGQLLVHNATTPVAVVAGGLCLATGAILVIRPLHTYYLWQ